MKTRFSSKIIKRRKIYDYKIWENTRYNEVDGNSTLYVVTDYNEKETLYKSSSFSSVQDFVDELESKIDNYTYGGIKEIW